MLLHRLLQATPLAPSLSAISGYSASTYTDRTYGLTVDSAGNSLLCGVSAASPSYGWLAKFDATDTLLWQRKQSLTTTFSSSLSGSDSSNNVYLIGAGYVTAAPYLPTLMKYNSAGTLQWQRKLSSADTASALGFSVNAAGDSFLLLAFTPTVYYGITAKYNSSGTLQWQRKLSSTYLVYVRGSCLTPSDDLLVVGTFRDGANATANERGFVVKYNTSGVVQWQYKIHWSIQNVWVTAAVDTATGDIYLGGASYISLNSYAVLTKLNSSGSHQWSRQRSVAGTQVSAVAVDPATGYVYSYSNLETTVVCMDASATVLWERYITADTGSRITVYRLVVVNNELLVAGAANHSGASKGEDAVMLRMPLTGGAATAAVGYINITTPSATTFTAMAAPTNVAAGLTDVAGTATDAAGGATDAAGAITFTNY